MRKHNDRFNGVTEEELYNRSLNDIVEHDLDIVFVNINPGLYSVYKQHHYSGPGNHFWRCLYDSGLTNKILKSTEDRKLLEHKMGLINMMERPSPKSCQELSTEEIKEASDNLVKKILYFKPKIVAFNGKTIYEIYTGSSVDKQFNFGKQTVKFANDTSDTLMFVMPSSSARCSQLPKVIDKVPFYLALKKLRDYLNGSLIELTDLDITFPDFKVALEVDNSNGSSNAINNTNGNDSKLDNSDNEDIDDDGPTNDESIHISSSTNNHKIKFVRLNNIPYSQIPPDILTNLKIQRQLKKNVTITTTKDYFNNKNKNGNTPLSKSKVSNVNTVSNASCSDVETASTATNDSIDYNMINNYNSNTTFNNTDFDKHSNGNSSDLNTSKLSSLILNVCSANTNTVSTTNNNTGSSNSSTSLGNSSAYQTNTSSTIQRLSTASTNTPSNQQNGPKTNVNANTNGYHLSQSSSTTGYSSNIPNEMKIRNIIAKSTMVQQQAIQTTQQNQQQQQQQQNQHPIKINNITNGNSIIIVSSNGNVPNGQIQIQSTPQQQQQVQIQHQPQQQNYIIVSSLSSQQTTNEDNYVFDTKEPCVEFELMRHDDLNDYYTFDSLMPSHLQPSAYLTDDYYMALKHELNKTIKLKYDTNACYDNGLANGGRKRCFTNINEATCFIGSSSTNVLNKLLNNSSINKRQCKVHIENL